MGLLALLALTTFLVAVIGVWVYHDQAEVLRAKAQDKIVAIGDLRAVELQGWRESRLAEAGVFCDNPAFISLARDVIETEDVTAVRDLNDWFRSLQANPSYDGVYLVDPDGQVSGLLPGQSGLIDTHIQRMTREALLSGEIVWLDLHRHDDDDPIHLTIVAPLLDRGSEEAHGALVLTIDPEQYLYPVLASWPVPSESGESLLVRRDGDDVLYVSPLRFSEDAPLQYRVPIEDNTHRPAVKGILGEYGAVESIDYRGVEVVASVNPIPDSGWILVSKMDAEEAYELVRDRLALILMAAGGLVVTAAGGTAFMWRNRRLSQLREQIWLREVIEASTDEIYAYDAKTLRFTFANAGAIRRLGYSHDELLGRMKVLEIKPNIPEEQVREMLAPLISGEREQVVFETEHRRKDGSSYPVEVSVHYFVTEAGPQFLSIATDLTEWKMAEEEMARRLAYEKATAVCMRILLREQPIGQRLEAVLETLLEVSEASRTYVFRDEDHPKHGRWMSQIHEVVAEGITPQIDNPHLQCLPYETDAPTLLEALLVREPFIRVVDEMPEDESVMRFDLESQDVLSVLILPIYVGDELWGSVGFDDCLSLRDWHKDDVRLMQLVADGIGAALTHDRTERELADHRLNLERLVEQRTVELAVANTELDLVNEELQTTNEELGCVNEELEASNEELQNANVELEIAMSDFEQANTELAAANATKSLFLASMSHELRTPLNSVIGFSGILGQGLSGPLTEEQAKQVEMINRSGRHLLGLIDNILDLSKVEAGGVVLDIETFDLVGVVQEVVDSVRPMAFEKGLDVVLETTDEAIEIETDCGKVRQILLNLAANAVKFTDEGTVRISVHSSSLGGIRVLVIDTGHGIPRKALKSIFEPFVQVDIPGTAKAKGTGLGLALSREYAHLLGGEVTVRSQEGVGSTFTLTLPGRRQATKR